MKRTKITKVAALGLLLTLGPLSAGAAPIVFNFGPASGNNGADFSFDLTVPTTITGDATLSLTLDGDFDGVTEYADVLLDSFSLGRILDGATANDAFDFGNGDDPDPDSAMGIPNPVTGSATIGMGVFASLIADGFLQIQVNTSADVDYDSSPNATVSGSISWVEDYTGGMTYIKNDMQPTNSVPEPGTLALLGLGLAGMGFARRRKS